MSSSRSRTPRTASIPPAPSYQLQSGEYQNGNLAAETNLVTAELAQGRAVVIPDAEGPRSEYIVTGMEGHATLDSVRAVERFAPAGLDGRATKVGLVGYSGGAHETAAANELQPAYAPELHLVGVAAGGVPVGNQENVRYLDGSVGAGLLVAVTVSVDRAYPQLDAASLLNAKGKALAARESTGCATAVLAAPYAHLDDFTTVPNAYQLPRVQRIIARNTLGHAAPTAPTFYYNAVHDELIWIKPLDELVRSYCARGARVDYYRDAVAQEHIEALHDFVPLALGYLEDRFAGRAVPSTCASAAPKPPAPSHRGRSCTRTRAVTLHPRIPARLAVRRIVVIVAGRRIRTLHHRVRTLRVGFGRHRRGVVRVELRITGRQGGRVRTVTERRTYRLCPPRGTRGAASARSR